MIIISPKFMAEGLIGNQLLLVWVMVGVVIGSTWSPEPIMTHYMDSHLSHQRSNNSVGLLRSRHFVTFYMWVICLFVIWPCAYDTRNNVEHFQCVPLCPLHTGFFSIFSGESVSVSNITENGWTDSHENFGIGRIWDKEQSDTFWGCCVEPLGSRIILSILWIRVC